MKIIKGKIVYRCKSKWFMATISNMKIKNPVRIKKKSDFDNIKCYITLNAFLKSKSIKNKENDILIKLKVDKLYILGAANRKKASTKKCKWKNVNKKCAVCINDCKQGDHVKIIVCRQFERI